MYARVCNSSLFKCITMYPLYKRIQHFRSTVCPNYTLDTGLLWCQMCTFFWPLRKKRCTILTEGTDLHIQQHIHQKNINLFLTSCYYTKIIVDLEKIQTNSTMQWNFVVRPSSKFQFAFGFNESVRIFFLIKFWKIIVLYLGCGCMTFDFTTQITSSYLLPHADE